MIEYYTSTLSPNCYFVALDNVIVAQFIDNSWVDRSIYRPVRNHYIKAVWYGEPYNPETLVNPEEWDIVKQTGKEIPLDNIK